MRVRDPVGGESYRCGRGRFHRFLAKSLLNKARTWQLVVPPQSSIAIISRFCPSDDAMRAQTYLGHIQLDIL